MKSTKKTPTSYVIGKVGINQNLYCEECNKTFGSKKYFNALNMNHHMTGVQTCILCSKELRNLNLLKQHLRRQHFVLEKEEVRKVTNSKQYEKSSFKSFTSGWVEGWNPELYCVFCDRSYHTKDHMRDHRNRTHNITQTVCVLCNKPKKSRHSMYQHYRNEHKLRNVYDIRFIERGGDIRDLNLPQEVPFSQLVRSSEKNKQNLEIEIDKGTTPVDSTLNRITKEEVDMYEFFSV